MGRNIPDEILKMLQTPIQKDGKTSPVTPKRQTNIDWIQNLPRTGLTYKKKEKQTLIYSTRSGEKLFIQYPGKESARKDEKKRPWDFRPRLYSRQDAKHHFDMTFGDMLRVICDTADALDKKGKREILRIFAALLYRMAFMLDHVQINTFDTIERNVIHENTLSSKRMVRLPKIFKYQPNKKIIDFIAKQRPRWGNMSFEGFVFYYELLVWNEDCKYYYRNHYIKKNKEWINDKGRVNTLLTGIRILGYLLADISLPDLLNGFSMGISPAKPDEIIRICGGLVKAKSE